MNKLKRFFLTTLSLFALFVGGHFGLLMLVDPLNVLPFDLSKNEFFVKEMRFQVGPLIRKYEFDSAIVGTSMAENFNGKEASEKLGGRFENISLSGGMLKERRVVLDYFFAKRDVKTLIISLDSSTTVQRNQGIPIPYWDYLYDDNRLDDLTVYANQKYFPHLNCHSLFDGAIGRFLFGECPENRVRKRVEDLTEWQSDPRHYTRFGGIEQWLSNQDNYQIRDSINEIIKAADLVQKEEANPEHADSQLHDPAQFEEHLMPLIKAHPETRFIFYFPPYSIFQYAIEAQTQPVVFARYRNFLEAVVLATEQYPNAEIYWFNDEQFLEDIANYKDLTHYHGDFNSRFLSDFAERRFLITNSDYREKWARFERRAMAFDLVGLAEKFKPSE